MLRVLRSKTLNINSVADLNENSCGKLPTFFSIYLLTFKTVSTEHELFQVGAIPPWLPCHASSKRFIIYVPRNISYGEDYKTEIDFCRYKNCN
jgi:hypothetical protein